MEKIKAWFDRKLAQVAYHIAVIVMAEIDRIMRDQQFEGALKNEHPQNSRSELPMITMDVIANGHRQARAQAVTIDR